MLQVYIDENKSTLINGTLDNHINGYGVFDTEIYDRNELINNIDFIKNTIISNNNELIGNPQILTEADIQSHMFMLIKNSINTSNQQQYYKIHTELADRIPINSTYCNDLIQQGDLGIDQSYTRRTDITVTFDGEYGEENRIHKGFSLNGKHIDIEIKHIRTRDSLMSLMKSIRRDLCKIKSLLHPDIINNANMNLHPNNYQNEDERDMKIDNEGCVVFGIMVISFISLQQLENYLNNGLRDLLDDFNQLNNIATLLLYKV